MWYYFVVFVKGKCFLILPFFISKQHDPWQNSISFCLCHSNMIRFKSVAIVSRTRGYCYSQHTQVALLIPFIHICCSTSWLARCSRCEQDIFFFQQWWLKVGKTVFDSILQHRFESENKWPCVLYHCLTSEFESRKV